MIPREGMTAANLAYLQGRRSKPRSQRMALRPTPNSVAGKQLRVALPAVVVGGGGRIR
jgi:hypothetical protein